MKKIKGNYQHGVYVSAQTKKEFKINKENYKKEGIKSAYALQIQKDIDRRTRQIETRQKLEGIKKAISESFKKDENIKMLGYTEKQFLEYYKQIEKYNKKIIKAKEKGKVLEDTETLAFPIYNGRINTKRLAQILRLTQQKPSEIANIQYNELIDNLLYIFGNDFVNEFKIRTKGVPIQKIMETIHQYDMVDFIASYKIKDFKESDKNEYWNKYSMYESLFTDTILVDIEKQQTITQQNKSKKALIEYRNTKIIPNWI